MEQIKNAINTNFDVEFFGEDVFLRKVHDGEDSVTLEMVKTIRTNFAAEESDATDEEKSTINAATDEEIRQAVNEFITNYVEDVMADEDSEIYDACSEYFWDHVNEDGYDRHRDYVEDVRNMAENGVDDYLFDCALEHVYDNVEIRFLTEDEVESKVENNLNSTAEYCWETMD